MTREFQDGRDVNLQEDCVNIASVPIWHHPANRGYWDGCCADIKIIRHKLCVCWWCILWVPSQICLSPFVHFPIELPRVMDYLGKADWSLQEMEHLHIPINQLLSAIWWVLQIQTKCQMLVDISEQDLSLDILLSYFVEAFKVIMKIWSKPADGHQLKTKYQENISLNEALGPIFSFWILTCFFIGLSFEIFMKV